MAKPSSAARAASGRDEELELDYSERAGFLTGRAASLAEWAFRKEQREGDRLIATLYQRQWARKERAQRPELVRERQNRWRAENREHVRAHERAYRAKRRKPFVMVCKECGKREERARRADYCSQKCRGQRWWKARSAAKNRGIRHMGLRDQLLTIVRTEPGLTLKEIHGRVPGAKYGSCATLLCELAKAGVVLREGRRYRMTRSSTDDREVARREVVRRSSGEVNEDAERRGP